MLTHLSIRNIVLIESCELPFAVGLCVLSGETGAGKSILLDALGLILGGRTDAKLVRHGEAQGSVAAEFDIAENDRAKTALAELEMDAAEQLIIRRSITSDGKTRCHINDQPVSVGGLKKLGETLVEIHGQHDQGMLQDNARQRDLLDSFAGLQAPRKALATLYASWRQAQSEVASLKEQISAHQREQEYLQHMRHELDKLAPEEGEEEKLVQARAEMMQSEKFAGTVNDALAELQGVKSVAAALNNAQRVLARSTLTQEKAAGVIEALERAGIEAEEAVVQLEALARETNYDANALDVMDDRLHALRGAARKYGVTPDGLANLRGQTEDKLTLIENQEKALAAAQARSAETRAAYLAKANELAAKRQKAAATIERTIEAELKPLKMGGTRFRVKLDELEEVAWAEHGTQSVRFEVATNIGKDVQDIPYAPLGKIASGGELSRFMLALKVAMADKRSASTLIFDEIDTGTGGAVADAIGQRLARLGQTAQVLVVTHLPQVAARGSQHLLVHKAERKGKISTTVDVLSEEERREELARMLSGSQITVEARQAAAKLLEQTE